MSQNVIKIKTRKDDLYKKGGNMKTNKLKKYKVSGLDMQTFKRVDAVVTAFSSREARCVAYDHYHMLFPVVKEMVF